MYGALQKTIIKIEAQENIIQTQAASIESLQTALSALQQQVNNMQQSA